MNNIENESYIGLLQLLGYLRQSEMQIRELTKENKQLKKNIKNNQTACKDGSKEGE